MKLLLTGATGFVGSHLLSVFHQWGWRLISLVRPGKTVPAGAVVEADFSYPIKRLTADQIGPVDYVIHSGADTRVEKSTADPDPFIRHNILGTYHMLEYCRNFQPNLKMFFYLSTSEVYGPAGEEDTVEDSPHRPRSPYAASKASAEDLCCAWNWSMGVPVVIANTMNVIGEGQGALKFIPLIVRKLKAGEVITVHGTLEQMGSRRYLYVKDIASALAVLVGKARGGERYHIAGTEEITNVDLVSRIARILGKEPKIDYLPLRFCRPGHDKRYALDTLKMQSLGWSPTPMDVVFERVVKSYA